MGSLVLDLPCPIRSADFLSSVPLVRINEISSCSFSPITCRLFLTTDPQFTRGCGPESSMETMEKNHLFLKKKKKKNWDLWVGSGMRGLRVHPFPAGLLLWNAETAPSRSTSWFLSLSWNLSFFDKLHDRRDLQTTLMQNIDFRKHPSLWELLELLKYLRLYLDFLFSVAWSWGLNTSLPRACWACWPA